MKFILGTILAFILLASMFTHGIQAEGGNSIWLTKTKRGIDISCPTGYIYEEKLNYNCVKRGDTSFLVSLTYDDLVIEEEFFNEKDIMKQAILVVKLAGDTKILEKKTSSWFDKITAEIKYEINGIKGFQRMIVFNDGTVITMNFLTNSNIGVADKILSNHVKILDPNQVKEIEKKNAQYAKQAQEKANLKQAEEKKLADAKALEKKKLADAKALEKKKLADAKKSRCSNLVKSALLSGCDFHGRDLHGKDLRGAKLSGANLTGVNFFGADLTGADLSGANLTGAELRGAELGGANLTGAYIRGADLRGANLTGADLTGAYIRASNLDGADLTGADLTGADIR